MNMDTNWNNSGSNMVAAENRTAIPGNGTDDFHRDESLATIEILVQSAIFALAVLGNSTVLFSLLIKRRKRRTRMHVLMIHLSVADLFVAFGSVLPQIAWDVTFTFKGGDVLCRLVKYMQLVAIYASSYVLVMTAIDRYVAICFPFTSRKWSTNKVHKMVAVAWALSLLFSVPQVFIFSYKTTPYGQLDCWAMFEPEWTLPMYITVSTVLVYIVPTLVLAFCYSNICVEVWRSSTGARLVKSTRSKQNSEESFSGVKSYKVNFEDFKKSNDKSLNIASEFNSDNRVGNCTNGDSPNSRYQMLHGKGRSPSNSESKLIATSYHQLSKNVTRSSHSNGVCLMAKTSPLSSTAALESMDDTISANRALLKKHSASGEGQNATCGSRKSSVGLSTAKIKTVKLTLTVVLCYFLCWSPFFIAQMWAAWDETAPFYGSAYTIILLMASLNSCTNPWIYLVFSNSVYAGLKLCANMICSSKRNYNPPQSSQLQ